MPIRAGFLGEKGHVLNEAGQATARMIRRLEQKCLDLDGMVNQIRNDALTRIRATASISVRKDSSSVDVGTEPRLNFVAGNGITQTVTAVPAEVPAPTAAEPATTDAPADAVPAEPAAAAPVEPDVIDRLLRAPSFAAPQDPASSEEQLPACLPESVIEGAKEILDTLERREADAMRPRATQMDLFARGDPLARELLALNVGALTAQKALRKLGELRKKAESLCP